MCTNTLKESKIKVCRTHKLLKIIFIQGKILRFRRFLLKYFWNVRRAGPFSSSWDSKLLLLVNECGHFKLVNT